MSDFISYLFAIFVITPLEAEMAERLQAVPSSEILAAGRACITVEGPNLLRYAQDNWGWAAANGLGVVAGLVDPITLLPQGNDNCRQVLQMLASRSMADA